MTRPPSDAVPHDASRLVTEIADALQTAVVLAQALSGSLARTGLAADAIRLEEAVQSAGHAFRQLVLQAAPSPKQAREAD